VVKVCPKVEIDILQHRHLIVQSVGFVDGSVVGVALGVAVVAVLLLRRRGVLLPPPIVGRRRA
jgi:hypothetical protein